jgi:hypothetical protein
MNRRLNYQTYRHDRLRFGKLVTLHAELLHRKLNKSISADGEIPAEGNTNAACPLERGKFTRYMLELLPENAGNRPSCVDPRK